MILIIAGFWSLWRGALHIRKTSGSKLCSAIGLILVFYLVPQVLRTIHFFPADPNVSQASEISIAKYPKNLQIFILWNSIGKVLLTFTFSLAIYRDAKAALIHEPQKIARTTT